MREITIMSPHQAYTRKQWLRAVNLSALCGWAGVVAPMTSDLDILFFAALIGIPIAFVSTWVVGAPILHHLMRKNISWLGLSEESGLSPLPSDSNITS